MPFIKEKKCDCNEDWAVYDETITMTGDDTFYFLGSCDKCGNILQIHCRIENIKVQSEWDNHG